MILRISAGYLKLASVGQLFLLVIGVYSEEFAQRYDVEFGFFLPAERHRFL